jgi:cytochrome bd-type quinol oxidase subunit 2
VALGRVAPAAALAGVTWVAGFFLADGARLPWPAAGIGLLALVAVVVAGHQLRRRRLGRAFGATAAAALLPLIAAGTAVAPDLLAGAAGQSALELLTRLLLPVVPVLLAAQGWLWWTFRHRVGPRSAVFF